MDEVIVNCVSFHFTSYLSCTSCIISLLLQREVRQLAKLFGCEFGDSFNENTTHVIIKSGKYKLKLYLFAQIQT